MTEPGYYIIQPDTKLQPFISLYWLATNTEHTHYPVLPDGSVDIVIKINSDEPESQLFGTTTRPTLISVEPDCRYLGIRFRPGQSRHFMQLAASELTDLSITDSGMLNVRFDRLYEQSSPSQIAAYLDQCLITALNRYPPSGQRIDHILKQIKLSQGQLMIDEAAAGLCKSRRQFERVFRETVGLTPKTYKAICRLQYATRLMRYHPEMRLADIAQMVGYTDQSHMNRDCKRLTGTTPTRIDCNHVAYIQYTC